MSKMKDVILNKKVPLQRSWTQRDGSIKKEDGTLYCKHAIKIKDYITQVKLQPYKLNPSDKKDRPQEVNDFKATLPYIYPHYSWSFDMEQTRLTGIVPVDIDTLKYWVDINEVPNCFFKAFSPSRNGYHLMLYVPQLDGAPSAVYEEVYLDVIEAVGLDVDQIDRKIIKRNMGMCFASDMAAKENYDWFE